MVGVPVALPPYRPSAVAMSKCMTVVPAVKSTSARLPMCCVTAVT